MFIVISPDKSDVWTNSKNDDFIRFLPEKLNCQIQELQIFGVPVEHHKKVSDFLAEATKKLVVENGKIKIFSLQEQELVEINEEIGVEIRKKELVSVLEEEITCIALKTSWPYQEINNELVFTGIELAE